PLPLRGRVDQSHGARLRRVRGSHESRRLRLPLIRRFAPPSPTRGEGTRYAAFATTTTPLPSLKVRHTPFGGGFDAFLEILGDAQLVLLDQFVVGRGQHAVGEIAAHGGAGRDQAERRAFRDLGGELH